MRPRQGLDNNCDEQVDEGFDVDGDGVTTCGGDCDDSDPEVQSTFGETLDLVLTHDRGTGTTTFNWTEPETGGTAASMIYDVIRTGDPADFDVGANCLLSNSVPGPSATDTVDPPPGEVSFHDIRAENQGGLGPMGTDSDGT